MKRALGSVLLAEVILLTGACGQNRNNSLLSVTILQGQEFAHPVQLPSGFRMSSRNSPGLTLDHYSFRIAAADPNVLLVGACRYENPSKEAEIEVCSPTWFAIDTEHSYSSREATQRELELAERVKGSFEMNGLAPIFDTTS